MIMILFALSFAVLLAAVSMLPSFFFASVKLNLMNTKLNAQKQDPISEPDQEIQKIAAILNSKITKIEKNTKNNFLVSNQVINSIVLSKMADIKISQITYDGVNVSGKQIKINGSASSRDRLIFFRKALEENTAFSKIDLPISNFVKGSNIQFYLTLTPSI